MHSTRVTKRKQLWQKIFTQNHRMAQVRRDFKDHETPIPYHRQGHQLPRLDWIRVMYTMKRVCSCLMCCIEQKFELHFSLESLWSLAGAHLRDNGLIPFLLATRFWGSPQAVVARSKWHHCVLTEFVQKLIGHIYIL